MRREYATLIALRAGKVVELEGLRLKMATDDEGKERKIQPGDLYVAERNSGPKLLTADTVYVDQGYVDPTTLDYSFNIYECVVVVEA